MTRSTVHLSDLHWPTEDVPPVAAVLAVSRAGLYEAIAAGTAPVRHVRVGSRIKIITRSVFEALGEPAPVRTGETDTESCRSDAVSV